MSLKRSHEAIDNLQTKNPPASSTSPILYESSPIQDRQSNFIALYTPSTTLTPKDLQRHPPYAKASHRILAWRLPSKQQTVHFPSQRPGTDTSANTKVIYEVGSLDDGEKYAGKNLEKVLLELDAVGSIVVARWYGGVMLGAVRFKHIQNCAREAIGKWRKDVGQEPEVKKVKVGELSPEQEAEQRARLAKVLGDRDSSILVLRDLLAEKKAAGQASVPNENPAVFSASQSPQRKLDYSEMPLARLKQLEKARDTTITWILKQIDEAEATQQQSDEKTPSKPNG